MTENNIFVYKHFLSLNISDFRLFFMEKLQPPLSQTCLNSRNTRIWKRSLNVQNHVVLIKFTYQKFSQNLNIFHDEWEKLITSCLVVKFMKAKYVLNICFLGCCHIWLQVGTFGVLRCQFPEKCSASFESVQAY